MTNVYLEKIAAMNAVEKTGYGSSAAILGAAGVAEVGSFVNTGRATTKVGKSFIKRHSEGKDDRHIRKLYDKVFYKGRERAAAVRKYTKLGVKASVTGAALGVAGSLYHRATQG